MGGGELGEKGVGGAVLLVSLTLGNPLTLSGCSGDTQVGTRPFLLCHSIHSSHLDIITSFYVWGN